MSAGRIPFTDFFCIGVGGCTSPCCRVRNVFPGASAMRVHLCARLLDRLRPVSGEPRHRENCCRAPGPRSWFGRKECVGTLERATAAKVRRKSSGGKTRRHNAYDGARFTLEMNFAPNDVGVGTEAAFPQTLAEHDDLIAGPGCSSPGCKVRPNNGGVAKTRETNSPSPS